MATASAQQAPPPPTEQRSLTRRVRDWLYDRTPPAKPTEAAPVSKPKAAPSAAAPAAPPTRFDVYQRIWGEGFSLPGGPAYALNLVKPFALKPAMSLLDIGCGLGGGTRAVAEEFGMWLGALEPDAELAKAGNAISHMKGFEKKAPIEPCSTSEFKLPLHKYDRVLMRESLHLFTFKSEVLKAIKESLKPDGQLIVTDFIIADREHRSDEVLRMQSLWPLPPDPWTKDEFVKALRELEFSVHILEDETAIFMRHLTDGWRNFMANVNREELTPDLLRLLAVEVERWCLMERALARQELVYVRAHVSRSKLRLMSDA